MVPCSLLGSSSPREGIVIHTVSYSSSGKRIAEYKLHKKKEQGRAHARKIQNNGSRRVQNSERLVSREAGTSDP
jgi:hypothetical protein